MKKKFLTLHKIRKSAYESKKRLRLLSFLHEKHFKSVDNGNFFRNYCKKQEFSLFFQHVSTPGVKRHAERNTDEQSQNERHKEAIVFKQRP